jgi:hypothetical protein
MSNRLAGYGSMGALFFFVMGCGDDGGGSMHQAGSGYVASATCPLKTPADWQRFLEVTSEDESWVRTCSDLDNCVALVGAFARHVQTDVLDLLGLCATDVENNPPIEQCTANLRRFVPAWVHQHAPDSYGFRQDNPTYLAAQTGPDAPPGMMDPPPQLLAAMGSPATIEQAARDNGWTYLTHPSGIGGVRTFVSTRDAQGRFDQWMLVGLDEDGLVPTPSIMSFIGVQKTDPSGKSVDKVRLHFRDYLLTRDAGSWKVELSTTLDGKCYACHGSGMRLLIPTAQSASVNALLLSYGLPDWGSTLDPADHGPPLGSALGCNGCHDGVTRGVLTVSTSEGMLRQKVVDQLSMRSPLGGKRVPDQAAMDLLARETNQVPPLSAKEVSALDEARADHMADYQSIVVSRFSDWKAWVMAKPCD